MSLRKRIYPSNIDNQYWLLLSPFLLLFIVLCIVLSSNELVGDEGRYLVFANNLLNGFYSPPPPDINLWNGPGYPLFIAPIIFLNLSYKIIPFINAILLYLSLVIIYKTIRIYSTPNISLFFTVLLGFYYPLYLIVPRIYTETLAFFLISLICLFYIKTLISENISWKFIISAAVLIAFLALTKVIFAYVILCMIFLSVGSLMIPEFKLMAKRSLLIYTISLFFCFPYLIYTYNLTGKIYYWADSGGMSLYTMSTPFENEWGDWDHSSTLRENPNHTVFIDSIFNLEPIKRDEAFKAKALDNIKNHPKKFLINWFANIGRMLFSYPWTNEMQSMNAYFTIVPNMFVVVFLVIAILFSLVKYKKIPKEIVLLFLFIIIYLFGSSLLSAYRRMFYITMPFWTIYLAFFFSNIISIKFKE